MTRQDDWQARRQIDVADGSLRLLAREDAGALFELVLRNCKHLLPWLSWVPCVRAVEDVARFIETADRRHQENGDEEFGLWLDGRLAGVVGVGPIDRHNSVAPVGYWLTHERWGQGIMRRAVGAVVDHVFGELGLHRVEIRCAVDNARGQRVPSGLGFVYEGALREAQYVNGAYKTLRVYSVLCHEWNERGDGANAEA